MNVVKKKETKRRIIRTIRVLLALIITLVNIYYPIVTKAQNEVGDSIVNEIGSSFTHEMEKTNESLNDASANSINDWRQAHYIDGIPWIFFITRYRVFW